LIAGAVVQVWPLALIGANEQTLIGRTASGFEPEIGAQRLNSGQPKVEVLREFGQHKVLIDEGWRYV